MYQAPCNLIGLASITDCVVEASHHTMSSSTTTTSKQANLGMELSQLNGNDARSTQLVNSYSGPSETVNIACILTHHEPLYDPRSTTNNDNCDNPNRVARAMTFPPKQNHQTLYGYIVTNFKVITIIIAIITLACTVIGIIAGIVIAIVLR